MLETDQDTGAQAQPYDGPRRSMTAMAASAGQGHGHGWGWDIRSVNGKGRDLRLRLPDWLPGLETAVREQLAAAIARGNVSCNLKLAKDGSDGEDADLERIRRAMASVALVQEEAARQGVTLALPTPVEILALRNTGQEAPLSEEALKALSKAVLADLPALLVAFEEMRRSEGGALDRILHAQLQEMEDLVDAAEAAAHARAPEAAEAFKAALARVAGQSGEVEPARIAQEIALLAVKADVTEELDRLRAHIAAARALLAADGAVGRKLDFLCQEFNREANTLCSKAQSVALTRVGLDLKALIDQLREQVQNLE